MLTLRCTVSYLGFKATRFSVHVYVCMLFLILQKCVYVYLIALVYFRCKHDIFALDTGHNSKGIRTVSTSLDLSASTERRRAATIASDSITYGVVPRLMILLAEQSCSSYRPGVLPATHSPPSVPQKQRVAGKMQKLSRLAAMMNRMKTSKP